MDKAVVVTAEHWEGGRISARTTVSVTDVHYISPVHAGNSTVILGIGRCRRKFFPVIVPVTPNH
jgi:acyl-CoA hydrolase